MKTFRVPRFAIRHFTISNVVVVAVEVVVVIVAAVAVAVVVVVKQCNQIDLGFPIAWNIIKQDYFS